MKRIESRSYRTTIRGIKLYLEDIEYIEEKLKSRDLQVVISDDKNIYDNLEELLEYKGRFPGSFEIEGKKESNFMELISIRLYNGWCTLYVSLSEDLKAPAYDIEKYLSGKKRKKIYSVINSSTALWQISTNFAVFLLFYFYVKNYYTNSVFIGIIIFWMAILFLSEMNEDSNLRISLTRKHENNFYSKNKEKIFLSLFSLCVGAAITYLVTIFTR